MISRKIFLLEPWRNCCQFLGSKILMSVDDFSLSTHKKKNREMTDQKQGELNFFMLLLLYVLIYTYMDIHTYVNAQLGLHLTIMRIGFIIYIHILQTDTQSVKKTKFIFDNSLLQHLCYIHNKKILAIFSLHILERRYRKFLVTLQLLYFIMMCVVNGYLIYRQRKRPFLQVVKKYLGHLNNMYVTKSASFWHQ